MVSCAVIGCTKRSQRDKEIKFYSIPSIIVYQCNKTRRLSTERRALWLSRIARADLVNVTVNTKVCSLHFLQGKPAALFDETHPDWAPTLRLGHDKFLRPSSAGGRYKRRLQIKPATTSLRPFVAKIDRADEGSMTLQRLEMGDVVESNINILGPSVEWKLLPTKEEMCLPINGYTDSDECMEIKKEPEWVGKDDSDTEPLPMAEVYVKAEYSDDEQDYLSGEDWTVTSGQEEDTP